MAGTAYPLREASRLTESRIGARILEIMAEASVEVESYSGYRADERPVRFVLGGHLYEVREVEDRWYSPGAKFFRVVADDGGRYVLRHEEAQDTWSLEAFRAAR